MSEDFFRKICTSHFIVTFVCESELESEHNCNILTPSLMAVSVVSFLFSRAAQPAAQGPTLLAFSTTSYQQLLWIRTQSGAPRAPSAWCGFPYHISFLTPSDLWLLVLTELYISSTPTQILEWHVWLSSSGNNSHAVQRSLSSGASIYECIMAFTLSHFINQICPRDLFRLLAIGMCHFLPMHHFEMACLAGSKVKIQHISFREPVCLSKSSYLLALQCFLCLSK